MGVCITNPYRILCPPCERAWCIWFGPRAAYHRLPASTCKTHWILVWSGRPLPTVTIHYHASILSLHRFLTFTGHHLRLTHRQTHIEHTGIEHSKTWAHSTKVSSVAQRWHSTHSTDHTGWLACRHMTEGVGKKKRKNLTKVALHFMSMVAELVWQC